MSAVPAPRSRVALRPRLTRLVALVAALGQLLVAVAAWADVAAERGGDARPHVERDGTRLHHAHVESQCALCAAQHLVSRPPPANHAVDVAPTAFHGSPQTVSSAPAAVACGVHLSRAPPNLV